MSYQVMLTKDAASDLDEIFDYIAEHDSFDQALHVLARIEAKINGLATFLKRGNHPKELLALGMKEYREAFFKPYRILYRIIEQRIYVYLIVDGRREMRTLLQRRLLRG